MGGNGNDRLIGGIGNDVLNGGYGVDTMEGGGGNDRYIVNVASDVVTEYENQGTDLVQSSGIYTLGSNIENLTLTGSLNLNGTGNDSDNIIKGNTGNNILRGEGGDDILMGNGGKDALFGGIGNDNLLGNNGNDNIQGGDGADNLFGNAGNDHLIGGNDNDRLIGGIGNDILKGGAGNDVFWINSGAGRAVIKDYSSGSDKIKLLGGLTEDDLSFSNVGGHTRISDDDDLLAIVQNTIADDITFI